MSPVRIRVVAALAALLILALTPGGIVTGGEANRDIGSALLATEDLPPILSPGGVTHEPTFDFDEASFVASGGLDKAAQTWQATEVEPGSPVLIVFDFRFLFPSPEAAQGYLDAAEPILSESVTGITLQADTTSVGEVLRHYAGPLTQGDVTIEVQNFLFRSGPVVAKVYIGGFGTTLDDALPIAQAAAARTDAWLAEQPSSSPAPASAPPEASAGPLPSEAAAVGTEVPYVDAEGVSRGLVTVREVSDPFTEHHEDYPPGEGTRYVMLGVAFEAAEDQTISADPYDILIQDSDGYLWAKASVTRPAEATIPELSSQDMAPGNRISGVIGYVVPADAELERVLYQPESGRLITLAELGEGGVAPAGSAGSPALATAGCEGIEEWAEATMGRVLRASEMSREDATLEDPTGLEAHVSEYADLAAAQASGATPEAAEGINQAIVSALEGYAASTGRIVGLDTEADDVTEQFVEAMNAFNAAGDQLNAASSEVSRLSAGCRS